MPALDLLHYPARDRQRRWRHRWTTFSAGAVVGVLVVGGASQWLLDRQVSMQQEQQRLQALLVARQQQRQALQAHQAQQGVWQQQVRHLQQVAQQQKAWDNLHSALQREARDGAVQWVSLELMQDRLALHGRAQSLQRMQQLQQRLAREWGLALTLSSVQAVPTVTAPRSLTTREAPAPSDAVEFVWHSAWPSLQSPSGPALAAPAESTAARPLP